MLLPQDKATACALLSFPGVVIITEAEGSELSQVQPGILYKNPELSSQSKVAVYEDLVWICQTSGSLGPRSWDRRHDDIIEVQFCIAVRLTR